jgi:hypothetical protein
MAHPRAGRPKEAPPVKFLSAVLYAEGFDVEGRLFPALEHIFGEMDFKGNPHRFGGTDYYRDEMGAGLERLIVSFSPLGRPPEIVEKKLAVLSLEERFEEGGCRRANIDPGYMDYFKIVLASFKEGPQKMYLGEGVYADPVLLYQDGCFVPLPWTFPDFKAGVYADELAAIRQIYKEARRSL